MDYWTETGAAPMLEGLKVLRVRFHLQAQGGTWPRFKGFLLHGALGATLKELAPDAYSALMGESDELGRPYVLLPPLDEATTLADGSPLLCEMTFMGEAARWVIPVLLAMQRMGQRGLGKGNARFLVTAAEAMTLETPVPFYTAQAGIVEVPKAVTALEIVRSRAMPGSQPGHMQLDFISPMRLKADNRLVRQAPDFGLLWQRLLGRVTFLAKAMGGPGWDGGMRAEMSHQATAIICMEQKLAWVDWPRRSSRQQVEMLFGGFVGSMRFSGEVVPFLPWFALAESLHLGGKTTFGLGAVKLTTPSDRCDKLAMADKPT